MMRPATAKTAKKLNNIPSYHKDSDINISSDKKF